MESESADVSAAARKAFMKVSTVTDLNVLKTLLTEVVSKPENKASIITAIGSNQGKMATPTIVAFAEDPAPVVRKAVVAALGKMKLKTEVERVSKALTNDSDLTVRVAAAKALGEIGVGDGNPALLDVVSKPDSPPELLAASVTALRNVEHSDFRQHYKAVDAVADIFDHNHDDVRAAIPATLTAMTHGKKKSSKSAWKTWIKKKVGELERFHSAEDTLRTVYKMMGPGGKRDANKAFKMLEEAEAKMAEVLKTVDAEDKRDIQQYEKLQQNLSMKKYDVQKFTIEDFRK